MSRRRRRRLAASLSIRSTEASAAISLDGRLEGDEREPLAAWGGRGVQNSFLDPRRRQQRRHLSGLVLNIEVASSKGAGHERVALPNRQAEGRDPARVDLDSLVDQLLGQQLAPAAVAKCEQMHRLGSVVGVEQTARPLLAEALEPAPHQQIRVTGLEAEAPHRIGLLHGPGFEPCVPRDSPEHGIDETAGAAMAARQRLVDRLGNDRVRRHAIQEQELKDRYPQQVCRSGWI